MKKAPAMLTSLVAILLLLSSPFVFALHPANAQGGIAGTWETIANGDDIRGLAVTHTHVWAGTHNGGAVSWSLDDGTFTQYLAPQTGIAGNDVRDVDTDDYRLWFATDNGVSRYDPDTNTWTTYSEADGVTLDNATAVAYKTQDPWNLTLWIGTSQIWNGTSWEGGGLSIRQDNGGWKTHTVDNELPSNNVTDIAFAPNGDAWVATKPYKVFVPETGITPAHWEDEGGGVAMRSANGWQSFTKEDSGLPDNRVNAVATAPDGRVWFATASRLAVYDPEASEDSAWTTYDTGAGQSNKIRDVTVDRDNRVWVTTYQSETTPVGVLMKFDGTNWDAYDEDNGLSSQILWSVLADDNGRIWVGTGPWCRSTTGCEGGGLSRFQPLDNEVAQVYRMADSHLASNRVTDVAVAGDGTLWVTTLGSGISMRDTSGQWHHFTRDDGLASDLVESVTIADDGTVWFGTQEFVENSSYVGGGINVYDGGDWRTINKDNSELPINEVLAIRFDADGLAWIGTGDLRDNSGAGLAVYAPDTETWSRYTVDDGLPSNKVTDIAFDAVNDRVWVATGPYQAGGAVGGGVALYENGQWSSFTSANSDITTWSGDGITGDFRAILVDEDGEPWTGTWDSTGHPSQTWPYYDAVIDHQAGDQWTATTFENQGLVSSLLLDADGTLWAGISHGTLWAGTDLTPEDQQLAPTRGGVRARIDGEWYKATAASSGLAGSDVTSLFLEPTGNLWVGTGNAGLSLLRGGGAGPTPTSTTPPTNTPSPTATEGPSPTPTITNTPAPPATITRTPIPVTPTAGDVVRPAEVPEAATLILVGTGLAGLGGYAALRWRSRNSKDE